MTISSPTWFSRTAPTSTRSSASPSATTSRSPAPPRFTAEDVPVDHRCRRRSRAGSATIDLTTRQHPVHGRRADLLAQRRHARCSSSSRAARSPTDAGERPERLHQGGDRQPAGFAQRRTRGSTVCRPTEAGSQLEWSQTVNGQPVYNFAICRVRYRAELNTAPDVRVFFRLFPAMTTSTDFQPTTTYRTGGQPGTKIPLLGIVGGEVATIPFFAEPRNPATMDLNLQTDTKNIFTTPEDQRRRAGDLQLLRLLAGHQPAR